jgi:hypothetical protein
MYDENTKMKMLLTTAVLAAVAALMAGPATAYVMDVEGGGGTGTVAIAAQPAQPGDPGTIPYLSHGVGVDESLYQGQPSLGLTGDSATTRTELSGPVASDELDPAIRTAIQAREAESAAAQASTGPGAIPYLSHGIGVDESLFQGASSVGLTGDSPLTRGDVASVSQPTAQVTSDGEFDWTWAGFGAGTAVLLAAGMTALYLSARNRDRVALP